MIDENTYSLPNWDLDLVLENDEYHEVNTYDALNRPLSQRVSRVGSNPSEISYSYNRRSLLFSVLSNVSGQGQEDTVESIVYNEKGQRESIVYGNGTQTRYRYEKDTFRISEIETIRLQDVLQDLRYVYDPSGNVISIENQLEAALYFNNQAVDGNRSYEYDALYRLSLSTGREHIGQSGVHVSVPDSQHDVHRVNLPHPSNGEAMQSYRQHYRYDSVGNMQELRHVSGLGSFTHRWTKRFRYNNNEEDRNALGVILAERKNNHLLEYEVGSHTQSYRYDSHGNMDSLQGNAPRGDYGLVWNSLDSLHFIGLPSGTSHYWYTSEGSRTRKVITNGDRIVNERIYIGSLEVYRAYDVNGIVELERESFHIQDDTGRIAIVDTKTVDHPNDDTEDQLIRYQYSNHLGSSSLELDSTGEVISYEEYYAYGSTSYQAINQNIKSASKRYRYTGMERDEESGMNYHTARYYLPWLCRWSSADPLGLIDGVNLYRYSRNNPIKFNDPSGTDPPDDNDSSMSITPFLTTGSLSSSGNFSLTNGGFLSGSTSTNGSFRSSFQLQVPSLDLNTEGLADINFSSQTSLNTNTSHLNANGWLVLGSIGSGLNLTTSGELNLVMPSNGPISQANGNLELSGSLGFSGFSLASFSGDATIGNGNFQASMNARSIAGIARLSLQANGTINDRGNVFVNDLSGRFNAGVPGLNLRGNVSGESNQDGGLNLSANARLKILGIPSLSITGSGSLSQEGYDFSGAFSGYIPPLSYARGQFSLNSSTGIDASAQVFGLTYTPELKISDPSPLSDAARQALGPVQGPSSPPSGLTLGYSYSRYNRGAFTHFSAGLMTSDFKTFGAGAYLRVPF
jgi:RHS repeat-associated protein